MSWQARVLRLSGQYKLPLGLETCLESHDLIMKPVVPIFPHPIHFLERSIILLEYPVLLHEYPVVSHYSIKAFQGQLGCAFDRDWFGVREGLIGAGGEREGRDSLDVMDSLDVI